MTSRIVHVALPAAFADWETGYLTTALAAPDFHRHGGFEVRYVGLTAEPVTSMGGMRVLPDLVVDDLSPHLSDLLVLPGAESWLEPTNAAFVAKAAEFLAAGTPVAAVCGATAALATAGLLDDRPHTSNAPEFLAATGYAGAAHYVDQPAVVDGDLVTASGVAPVELARAVLERLGTWPDGVLDSWFKLYRHQDPAGFHELMAASA